MKNNEPVIQTTTTERLKKLVSGVGKTDAVAACLATIMATSAGLASCTLDTMGTCNEPCGPGSTPDAGLGGTAGTGGETAKGGEAGTGGVAGMAGSGGLDGGGGQSGVGGSAGVGGTAGEGGVAGQGGLGGQAGGLDAGGAGQGGSAGQGGEINDGGLDGDAATDAGCTDIPVLLKGTANNGMGQYEYFVRQGSCAGPIKYNSLTNGTWEKGDTELCLKSGDILMIQVNDPFNSHAAVFNSPVPPIDKKYTTFGILNPLDEPSANSFCAAASGLGDPSDTDLTADGYRYPCGADTDAGLPGTCGDRLKF